MSRDLQKRRTLMACTTMLSTLSTCKRKQVGAILVPSDFSEIIAIGYNGPPAGLPNDSCLDLDGACGCIHAEANCLVKARRHTARDLTMFVTRAPCATCAGLIINSRVVRVVQWASPSSAGMAGGLELLSRAGIAQEQLQ